MVIPKQSVAGAEAGRWYMMSVQGGAAHRVGYCASACDGHETREDALEHYLRFQLDRESDLWLDRRSAALACEICGRTTTLRARLGRNQKLFVLCATHQSTASLEELFRRRTAVVLTQDA
ncbi:MAG TPA: hypothetical protein VJ011_00970 [Steroidobacteraceae bacterium]|nr:hypothetical protein [Steroidobacteraceae bacterium]